MSSSDNRDGLSTLDGFIQRGRELLVGDNTAATSGQGDTVAPPENELLNRDDTELYESVPRPVGQVATDDASTTTTTPGSGLSAYGVQTRDFGAEISDKPPTSTSTATAFASSETLVDPDMEVIDMTTFKRADGVTTGYPWDQPTTRQSFQLDGKWYINADVISADGPYAVHKYAQFVLGAKDVFQRSDGTLNTREYYTDVVQGTKTINYV
ncbi:uncharacterized protein I303_103958 [Kwoniella dejecticola CBS 10117]|uniref:Uncharacterized protein n=1 Tax=Kwoniella dejecticola CBS 10117 TaxID=1296121 RepID=A0A1A6A870_9TREE|nr:uncharacterized protein I303_03976 [Kwoniella dejecticola CBS 10117]OBR86255.1 hypothetical protein I303_03976 [Kwoniella dejecticola CBS 10117]